MGYSATLAEHLADKSVTGVDPQDVEEVPMRFDSVNAELENIRYTVAKDNTFLIHDDGDNVRYIAIEKDTPAKDIEGDRVFMSPEKHFRQTCLETEFVPKALQM